VSAMYQTTGFGWVAAIATGCWWVSICRLSAAGPYCNIEKPAVVILHLLARLKFDRSRKSCWYRSHSSHWMEDREPLWAHRADTWPSFSDRRDRHLASRALCSVRKAVHPLVGVSNRTEIKLAVSLRGQDPKVSEYSCRDNLTDNPINPIRYMNELQLTACKVCPLTSKASASSFLPSRSEGIL
jgi:hypothetical protein